MTTYPVPTIPLKFPEYLAKPEDSTLSYRQRRLAAIIARFTGGDGIFPTALPGVTFVSAHAPTEPVYGVQDPALCIIAQGRKRVLLGGEQFVYDRDHFLLVSVDLPAAGQVIQARPDEPYLCLRLVLEPAQIRAFLAETRAAGGNLDWLPPVSPKRGIAVSRVDFGLMDAVTRLAELLETPGDIPMLAPMIQREIIYRLLRGEQGGLLRRIAAESGREQSVGRAIEWIKTHYAAPLHIETMARDLGMSPSGLHHHFKAVTALSPLQFQKQLRLQEARRLMLADDLDAASAGYRVGYESASQFSREYRRLFGEPPSRDIARLRSSAKGI